MSQPRHPLKRQDATTFSETELLPSETEPLSSFMDKKDIKSPFVKVLVTVDSSKGSDQPNLFEVDLGTETTKTTWDYLNELMTKCDLYLITPETPETPETPKTPSRALKITSFAPNTGGGLSNRRKL